MSLSADDRALLRQVFTWARANGWSRVTYFDLDEDPPAYAWETDRARIEIGTDGELDIVIAWVSLIDASHNATQIAVDALVALGVLPARFSSAYRTALADAEVEWSPRLPSGRAYVHSTFTEAGARRYVEEVPSLRLFRRHVGPWTEVAA